MKSSVPVSTLLLILALAAGAAAQPASKPTPKLIVAISVDQFSADLFAEYRQFFTGGLGRLSREGVVFPSGYQSHAATETCPGHSTILTGVHPDRTGIIANDWYENNEPIYCAKDKDNKISAARLESPTLGDRMEVVDSATRSVSVAGKDRAAVMMGGHKVDQIWWWDGDKAAFFGQAGQTSSAVDQINKDVAEEIPKERTAIDLPPVCMARDHVVLVSGSKTVGSGRFARSAGDPGNAKAFRSSPDLDRTILALAWSLAEEMGLDKGPATNILAIGLSATDYVGHVYGTEGAEMCLQLLALDRELGSFFEKLDATGVDYVVVLTADHGGHDLPERHQEHGAVTAVRVKPGLDLATATISKAVATKLKLKDPVLYAKEGNIYVDTHLSAKMKGRVVAKAKKLYEAHPQVEKVFTQADLQAVPRPTGPPESWSLKERARASFFPKRSGDLIVLLKPRITPITEEVAATATGYVATHGSPWDYDRRVPILFWRKGITAFEQPLSVETVDIAPTLATLIKLQIPVGAFDGRCLDLDAGSDSTCN